MLVLRAIGRPNDAEALADAVSRYQNTVESRLRESEIDRAAQSARAEEEVKRRRVSTALAAAIVVLVVAVGGGAVWLQTQKTVAAETIAGKNQEVATKAREAEAAATLLAEQEKENARQEKLANEKLRWQVYKSDIRGAQAEIQKGRFSSGRKLLSAHIPGEGEKDHRGFEWHYLYHRCPNAAASQVLEWEGVARRAEPISEVEGAYTRNYFHAMSRDGARIAAILFSEDRQATEIAVWNTATGRRVWTYSFKNEELIEQPEFDEVGMTTGKNSQAPLLRLSDDGRFVGLLMETKEATGLDSNKQVAIQVWDLVENLRHVGFKQDVPNVCDFAFQPESSCIAVATTAASAEDAGQLVLWDFHQDIVKSQFAFSSEEVVKHLTFSPGGDFVAVTMRSLSAYKSPEVDPDFTRPQTAAGDGILVVDMNAGKRRWEAPGMHFRQYGKCAFSPDGTRLAVNYASRSMYVDPKKEVHDGLVIWDVASGDTIGSAPTKLGFGEVKFSKTGRLVMLIPQARILNVEVYRVADASPVLQFENPNGGILQFSHDEKFVQAIDYQGIKRQWKLPQNRFQEIKQSLGYCALSGDGKTLVSKRWQGDDKELVLVFDSNGELLQTSMFPETDPWQRKALSHDGAVLGVYHVDDRSDTNQVKLWLWDVAQEKQLGTVFESTGGNSIPYWNWKMSPTEPQLAAIVVNPSSKTGVPQHELRIWNIQSISDPRIIELGKGRPQC